ncbi:MAG: hypothetical protein A2X80_07900 [Geobacteraceae bacterium GWB2_52_12]|nr:MAG: hypothetical protein A2X80_07900 [Geobacteraceae bacterium GWB2_52_12]
MKNNDFVVSGHAMARAKERGINRSAFWAARRQALRTHLFDHLVEQQQNLSPMLTEKSVHAKVGDREYKASKFEIATRLDVDGITFAVGIRREGEALTPLTVTTVWS